MVVYHRRAGGQSQHSTLLDLDAASDRIQTVLTYARRNLNKRLSTAGPVVDRMSEFKAIQSNLQRGNGTNSCQGDWTDACGMRPDDDGGWAFLRPGDRSQERLRKSRPDAACVPPVLGQPPQAIQRTTKSLGKRSIDTKAPKTLLDTRG